MRPHLPFLLGVTTLLTVSANPQIRSNNSDVIREPIAFFSASAPTHKSPHPLASNIFTNRFDLEGQDPGATIVILFDALNTSFEDQAYARQHILRFLKTVKPQDHVAIFESLAKSGLILQCRLAINAASSQVRILVRDAASGALGSVTISVKQFF